MVNSNNSLYRVRRPARPPIASSSPLSPRAMIRWRYFEFLRIFCRIRCPMAILIENHILFTFCRFDAFVDFIRCWFGERQQKRANREAHETAEIYKIFSRKCRLLKYIIMNEAHYLRCLISISIFNARKNYTYWIGDGFPVVWFPCFWFDQGNQTGSVLAVVLRSQESCFTASLSEWSLVTRR